MIKVSIVKNGDLKEWDRYVENHPEGCVFQTSTWRDVVHLTYGHQPFYLTAERDSKVCGVLPLFLIDSFLFGRVLATCPYASMGAICADDEESSRALVQKAVELARELKVRYTELKSTKITTSEELQRHTDYVNYYIPLHEPDVMWNTQFEKNAKKKVRQAEKLGLTLARGHHLLDAFYHMLALNMRRLGTPVHSRLYYQNILNLFGSRADIFVARYQDIPVAGVILIRYRNEVVSLMGVSRDDYFHVRPNNFLYWEVLKASYHSGATRYDFGRSLAGSGPAEFKESWGAESRPLYYEFFLNRQKTIPRVHQGNPRYQLYQSAWKRLPLSLTIWLGPRLIKDIP